MEIKDLFNERYISDPEYYEFIKGKDVVVIGPGSNSLYIPNCGDFVNGFDIIAHGSPGKKGEPVPPIIDVQKLYPSLLGNRLDVLYRPAAGLLKSQAGWPEKDVRGLERQNLNLKYFLTKNEKLSKLKFTFKHSYYDRSWYKLLRDIMHKQVPREFRKRMNTGQAAIAHLLLYQPRTLYILGYNFYMYGSVQGYYAKAENRTDVVNTPTSWIPKVMVTKHSLYFSWKMTKILYNLFDNVDGDPMFKEIMDMSDEEYKQANLLN